MARKIRKEREKESQREEKHPNCWLGRTRRCLGADLEPSMNLLTSGFTMQVLVVEPMRWPGFIRVRKARVGFVGQGAKGWDRGFSFRKLRFSVWWGKWCPSRFCLFSLWAKWCRLACAKSSLHFHGNCVVLSLFGQEKKHVSKMTQQLTVETNWG